MNCGRRCVKRVTSRAKTKNLKRSNEKCDIK
jgi:hypothetical protein